MWCVLQPRGYKGGYFFDYSGGQVGRLYRGSNCQGSYDSVGRDDCEIHQINHL
ncbi:unnamed protein product [Spirodela intermedia]|uniref:Uncharacterized protein n=1 Tax=Spirodela intermedia TaxID=51605 RepID=A0ABN7EA75_SPIIN|nr:unnamed protein product [Spirodela intermedia]